VSILVLTMVLNFVDLSRHDLFTSLLISAGTFVLSLIIAGVLMLLFRMH
jgi:hypothetical protein